MLLRFYLLVQVFRTKSNLFDVLHAYSVEKRLMLSSDQVTDQRQFELEEGICTYFVQTSGSRSSQSVGGVILSVKGLLDCKQYVIKP